VTGTFSCLSSSFFPRPFHYSTNESPTCHCLPDYSITSVTPYLMDWEVG
jgi:hypothetical protein